MTAPRSTPAPQTQLAPPPSHDARERVVAQLSSHFAEDRLTLPELERRVHIAYATQSTTELEQLLTDLAPYDPVHGDVSSYPAHGSIRTILSSSERGGPIFVPRKLEVHTVLGSTQLDLTRASFAPGVTEIEVNVVLGNVEISLPPDVQVSSEGSPFVGSFALKSGAYTGKSECIVRITGHAVLSNVETWVVAPGATRKRSCM
jgi:hypothetical protein